MNALTKVDGTALSTMTEPELMKVLQASLYPGAAPESIKMVLGYNAALDTPSQVRPLAEWHDDDGSVMWFTWKDGEWLGEPCYIGSPLCEEWPGYHTHWMPHPNFPAPLADGVPAAPAPAEPWQEGVMRRLAFERGVSAMRDVAVSVIRARHESGYSCDPWKLVEAIRAAKEPTDPCGVAVPDHQTFCTPESKP